MSRRHTQTTQQPGDVFFLTILGSIASDRQTSRPHTDNIPGISKLYPGYIQAASKLHPGCIQTTSRLHPHPGNIKATSRKYSGYIQATFRLNPGYIQATSRLHPGVITGVAERRIAERRLSSLFVSFQSFYCPLKVLCSVRNQLCCGSGATSISNGMVSRMICFTSSNNYIRASILSFDLIIRHMQPVTHIVVRHCFNFILTIDQAADQSDVICICICICMSTHTYRRHNRTYLVSIDTIQVSSQQQNGSICEFSPKYNHRICSVFPFEYNTGQGNLLYSHRHRLLPE